MINRLKRPLGNMGGMEAQEDVLRRILDRQTASDGTILRIDAREQRNLMAGNTHRLTQAAHGQEY